MNLNHFQRLPSQHDLFVTSRCSYIHTSWHATWVYVVQMLDIAQDMSWVSLLKIACDFIVFHSLLMVQNSQA